MKITRRSIRVVATYILICICLRYILYTDLSINSSIESSVEREYNNNDDEKLKLCGHEIKDMPPLSLDNNTTYGVYNWNRNMANGIIIENRTDNEYMYGRTLMRHEIIEVH